jgi:heptosyltransferase-3
MSPPRKQRILVFVQGTIGDTIVSVPALRALRRHYGAAAHFTLLHETHSHLSFNPQNVLNGLGIVDDFISYPFSFNRWEHRVGLLRLLLRLRSCGFQAFYYLIGSSRVAAQIRRDDLFFRFAGILRRHGFNSIADERLRPRLPNGGLGRVPQEAILRMEAVESAGIDTSEERRFAMPIICVPALAHVECDQVLKKLGVDLDRPMVAIAPGAKQAANVWPLSRMADVGHRILAGFDITLVVVGGAGERDAGIALTEHWSQGHNLCGGLSVLATASLLARCRLLVGLDTGTTHLAASQGTPCVAVYSGRNWPGRWEPFGTGHVVVRREVPCQGCQLKNCNVDGHPCLESIEVDDVWPHIETILNLVARPAALT